MKEERTTDFQQVAVITRTLNRPLFLERAMESVLAQTHRGFTWVIVNDGGAVAPVDEVATRARSAGLHVLVRHHAESQGMEAASNAGIALAAQAAYVAIHDDDDSWQPGFLEKTVAFLESHPHYAAVVTHGWFVREALEAEGIRVLKRRPLNRGLRHIAIPSLYVRNLFPPISLLFRRSAYESVGGFDEALPVQGDWDFNLRLIMYGDIGVMPEILANYHVRPHVAGEDRASNTVLGRQDLHHEYETIIRNRMLRAALQQMGTSGGLLFACLEVLRGEDKKTPRTGGQPLPSLFQRLRSMLSGR